MSFYGVSANPYTEIQNKTGGAAKNNPYAKAVTPVVQQGQVVTDNTVADYNETDSYGNHPNRPRTIKEFAEKGGELTPNAMAAYMPDYRGILDQNGMFKDGFEYKPEQVKYGGLDSYNQYKDFATSKGPSEYYNQQAKLIDQGTAGSLDGIRQDQARNQAQGMSSLATSGGLSGGARERVGMNASLAGMNAQQGVYRDAAMGKTQAGIADYQNRIGALGNLTQMDTNRKNMNTSANNLGQMWNIDNKQKDVRQGNMYDLEQWGKVGDIAGSGAASAAMSKGPSKKWYEF